LYKKTNRNIMTNYKQMADAIRALSMDAVQQANSGHPGMPMGFADVATVLFADFLKFNPKDPKWANRDRFILSAGHGSMLLYSLLYLTGYEDITIDDIKNFRQLGAKTAGHPEYGYLAGIETTTGPLGQGIANGVGMAISEKMMSARFTDDLVNHYTYVAVGDGCLMEGISQEAISLAGHLKLNKLIVLWDDNGITIDGKTDISTSEDMHGRFNACGWDTISVDGHNHKQIAKAIAKAKKNKKPTLIACKTIIGYGSPNKSGTSGCHGSPLGADEIASTKKALGIDYPAFEIPQNILDEWRKLDCRIEEAYRDWKEGWEGCLPEEYKRFISNELPENWQEEIEKHKQRLMDEKPKVATRKASQDVLEVLTQAIPEMIGGSADLTGSNNTKTGILTPITADDFSGRYIYYGIREHAMAAIMNGMALYGGFVPYGGTFLVFSDYCRGSIRLSALMKQRVIYVMTHDSIGLGEDGPTHQPVEHLASLRAIPNLLVFRPADAVETAECWEIALETNDKPSLLALSRQGLPTIRGIEHHPPLGTRGGIHVNPTSKGGYIVSNVENPQVSIIATGSEVEIAMNAQGELSEKGINANVVSIPCFELFDEQSDEYKKAVLGNGIFKIGIEAGIKQGWEKYIGDDGIFIGMDSFGASAPANQLYEKFGITVERVVEEVMKKFK